MSSMGESQWYCAVATVATSSPRPGQQLNDGYPTDYILGEFTFYFPIYMGAFPLALDKAQQMAQEALNWPASITSLREVHNDEVPSLRGERQESGDSHHRELRW